MKKAFAIILILASFTFLLSGCSLFGLSNKQTTTSTKATKATEAVDLGTEKSKSSCESKAKSYCKDQFKETYGGYKITKYNFGSIKYLGKDEYYHKYSISGNYTFTNKYGKSENKNFTMKVKVYRWTKNPLKKTDVTYYY